MQARSKEERNNLDGRRPGQKEGRRKIVREEAAEEGERIIKTEENGKNKQAAQAG